MPAATTTKTSPAMVTDPKAADLERRLNVLESRVGVSLVSNASASADNNSSVDDRLSRLRIELERKICASNTVRGGEQSTSYKEIQKLLRELDPGIALTHQQQPLLYKRQEVLAGHDQLSRDFRELDAILKLLTTGTTVDGGDRVETTTSAGLAGSAATKLSGSTFATPVKGLGLGTMSSGLSSSTETSPSKAQKQQQGVLSQQLQTRELQQKLKQVSVQSKQLPSSLSSSSAAASSSAEAHRNSNTNTAGEPLRLDAVTQAPILVQHAAAGIVPQNRKRVEDLRTTLQKLQVRTQSLTEELRTCLECYHTATMAVSEKIVRADERIEAKKAALAAS